MVAYGYGTVLEAIRDLRDRVDTSIVDPGELTAAIDAAIAQLEAEIASAVSDAEAYTDSQVAALAGTDPDLINTLNELHDLLGADPDYDGFLAALITKDEKGAPDGVATLDANQRLTWTQLPSPSNRIVSARHLAGLSPTDTYAGLQDILDALGNTNSSVYLPGGTTYAIGGNRLVVPHGAGFYGDGERSTVLSCTGDGGITIGDRYDSSTHPRIGQFAINGGLSASNPVLIGRVVEQVFEPVRVVGFTDVGCRVFSSQNSSWYNWQCTAGTASSRYGLWVDNGVKNAVFNHCTHKGVGVAGTYIHASDGELVAGDISPRLLTFVHGLNEQITGDVGTKQAAVLIESGSNIRFYGTQMNITDAPAVKVVRQRNAGGIILHGCQLGADGQTSTLYLDSQGEGLTVAAQACVFRYHPEYSVSADSGVSYVHDRSNYSLTPTVGYFYGLAGATIDDVWRGYRPDAPIGQPTGGTTVDVEARAAITQLLARVQD